MYDKHDDTESLHNEDITLWVLDAPARPDPWSLNDFGDIVRPNESVS
jgi:hypothetical protein